MWSAITAAMHALGVSSAAWQDQTVSLVPSLPSLSHFVLDNAQIVLGGSGADIVRGTSTTCSNPQLSCKNSSAVTDLCCFNAPGGQLLLTQFWDTHPATGPAESWTLHGLWPDHCDGTYDVYCDSHRNYRNITRILQSFGRDELLSYMETYWKDYQGDDENFWEHEWGKHGTCISTLSPTCYSDYQPTIEVSDFFERTVDLFKALPSYEWLAAANILPSHHQTYTFAAIQDALESKHGHPVTLGCRSSELNEIWYHYDVRGSVQTGEFVAAAPDGAKSSCPHKGIKYLPKGASGTSSTTMTTATRTASTVPTGTGAPFSGKGHLNVFTDGVRKGCIIGAGTWYASGTCATFTAVSADSGFTLASRKGNCAVLDGTLTCGKGVSNATVFSAIDGELAANGNTSFYAAAAPSGIKQQAVYTTLHDKGLVITWQNI